MALEEMAFHCLCCGWVIEDEERNATFQTAKKKKRNVHVHARRCQELELDTQVRALIIEINLLNSYNSRRSASKALATTSTSNL